MEQLDELKNSWSDVSKLLDIYIHLAKRQLELASNIAVSEANFNSTFITEREESYKGTDSMARARAKQLVGTSQTQYDYEFQTITSIMNMVSARIVQLGLGAPQLPEVL